MIRGKRLLARRDAGGERPNPVDHLSNFMPSASEKSCRLMAAWHSWLQEYLRRMRTKGVQGGDAYTSMERPQIRLVPVPRSLNKSLPLDIYCLMSGIESSIHLLAFRPGCGCRWSPAKCGVGEALRVSAILPLASLSLFSCLCWPGTVPPWPRWPAWHTSLKHLFPVIS